MTVPTVSKTGYTCTWNTAPDGKGTTYNSGASYKPSATGGNVTLYARCSANKYNISYSLNNGTKGSSAPTSADYGSVINITNPTKTVTITGNVNGTEAEVGSDTSKAQTFAGWTASNINTSTANYGTSSTTVSAVWSNASTKVTAQYFKNLNPTNNSTVTLTANWNAVEMTVPTISKTGYACTWNTKSDGKGTPYNSGASYKPSATEGNVTLYARCTVNSYTLTVKPNGGTFDGKTTDSTYSQNYGTTKSIAAITGTNRAAYTITYNGNTGSTPNGVKAYRPFTGWDKSGSGSITTTTPLATTTQTYTFEAGAGTLTAGYSGTSEAITLATPTKNYTITYNVGSSGCTSSKTSQSAKVTGIGWYTAATGGTKVGDFGGSKTFTASSTIYAQWNSQTDNQTLATITKTGYTCTWNTASDGKGTTYNSGASGVTVGANTTLYAISKVNNYYIDLNWKVDGTSYSGGDEYEANQLKACLKIGGTDRGCVADYHTSYPYGTSWEIYKLQLGGVDVAYTDSGTLGASNLSISPEIFSMNFSSDNSYGTVSLAKLLIPKGYTYSSNGAEITTSDGRKVTANAADVTCYKTSFNKWSSTSGTVSASTTIKAYFTGNVITSTITFDPTGATAMSGTFSVTATCGSEMPQLPLKMEKEYTVEYSANYDGGSSPSSDTITYTFGGFYTAKDGSGTQYYTAGGKGARNWDKTEDTKLYAYWTASPDSVTLPTLTRTGYNLSGWYDSPTGGTEIGVGGASYTPTTYSKTLYARWSAIKSTVTLNNQGATSAGSTSVTATYGSEMPKITKPTRAYTVTYNYNGNGQKNSSATATYTFGGYYTETKGGGTQYYTKDGTSAKNWDKTVKTTLYANWASASVTLPTPIKKGSIFSGWYTVATGGTKIGAGGVKYTPTKNITLYAQWKPANWAISSPATGANDLATAISLAKAGATLTLQNSYADTTSGKVSKNLNFDFGTYTLTRNSYIYLTDKANVTFNGDNDTGGVTNTAATYTIWAYSTTSVAEFKGGVYQNKSNSPVFCNLGQSTITDGVFISADANTIQNGTSNDGQNKGLLWISGGTFIANGSTGGSAVIRNLSDDHWPLKSDPNNYEHLCDHSCSVHINGGSFEGRGGNKNGVYQNTTDGKGLVHFPWHSTSSVDSLSKYSLVAGNGSILANGGSFHAKITNYLKSSSGVTFGTEALCSYSTFPSVKCSELLDK